MSSIEYNNLLFEISQRLEELNVLDRLLFMCRGKLASGSEDSIQDVRSLFQELEEQNNLGADRLEDMKELLKGVGEWSFNEKVETFERKKKEYNRLLKQIIQVLDELNDVERLPFAEERYRKNVRAIFKMFAHYLKSLKIRTT